MEIDNQTTFDKAKYTEKQKVERIQRLAKTIYYYDRWPRLRSCYRSNLWKDVEAKFLSLGYAEERQIAEFNNIINAPVDRLTASEKDIKLTYQIYQNQLEENDKMEELSIKLTKEIIELNGGKFPSNITHGPEVVLSCWLVFQHSDRNLDFMKYG